MLQLSHPETLSVSPRREFATLRRTGCLSMKAERLINENIGALLRGKGTDQKTLAQWCRKTEVWLSFKLAGKRAWKVDELDRVADFFGIATYQLLQPGIAVTSERRTGYDRRSVKERRMSHAARVMLDAGREVEAHRHGAKGSATPAVRDTIKRLAADFEGRVSALLSEAESRRSAAGGGAARAAVAGPRRRRRGGGALDVEKPEA